MAKYRWCQKVFGRQKGQVEDLTEKKEPSLPVWIKAGLVVPAKEEKGAHQTSPATVRKDDNDT